jgi:hypothetical protein
VWSLAHASEGTDGGDYWLADGWHRVCAALCLDWQAIAAEVRPGGLREAEWHSFSVNATHGYARGKDDVGRILGRIFGDPEWSLVPLRAISRHANIPFSTVQERHAKYVLSDRPGQIKPAEREVTRGGSTYTMDTGDIGRRAPEFIDNEATWHEPGIYRRTDPADLTGPPPGAA